MRERVGRLKSQTQIERCQDLKQRCHRRIAYPVLNAAQLRLLNPRCISYNLLGRTTILPRRSESRSDGLTLRKFGSKCTPSRLTYYLGLK